MPRAFGATESFIRCLCVFAPPRFITWRGSMPAVFEPNSALTGGAAQLWLAASGGAAWGGCVVLVSFDGNTYSDIGTITAPTQQGLTYADFPAYGGGAGGADSSDTLSVDLAISGGVLPTNATNADADAHRTLCWLTSAPSSWAVDGSGNTIIPAAGELIAYGAVAQGGTSTQFQLGKSGTNPSAYIRRGLYGTSSPDWPMGSSFTRVNLNEQSALGNSLLTYDIPTAYIAKPIYLKFLSFNTFGNALQDPSTVTPYKYTPTGAGYGAGSGGVPAVPTGLSATGISGGISLLWTPNATTDNVQTYTVLRATSGGGPYSAAWTGSATGWTDTNVTIGTTYYYEVEASNAAGTSAASGHVSAAATAIQNGGRSITAASSPVALLPSDSYVGINNTSGGALQVSLPSSPSSNQTITIADESGNAGTYNWTIKNGAGGTVGTVVANGGSISLHWTGAVWQQIYS